MDKIWLKHYPPGVPEDIDMDEFHSVVDVLRQSVEKFGDRPAYTNLGTTLSYADVDRLSRDFAAYLRHVAQLSPGDRVAVMMPNLLQYPIAIFGILRAGMVVVNVNPLYKPRELAHQLTDAGARAIVIVENFAATLERALNGTRLDTIITTRIGDMLPQPRRLLVNLAVKYLKRKVPAWKLPHTTALPAALSAGAATRLEAPELGHEDMAFLQYTGGTTGPAKGAVLTHGNIVANLQQASAWLRPSLREGSETIITALPLYHIFALTANCLTFLKIGGLNVLITDPRDMPAFVRELGKHRFTAITGVNTLFNGLLNAPGFGQLDFSSLRLALGGGMAVQRGVAERWKAVTGVPIIEAYGLTETSPAACINPLDLSDYNGSIGLPIPSTECSIRDDDGNQLPIGEAGELCIRGPQVMRGYWNNPDETGKVLSADGYLRTGDIARMDENGYFYIVDRKKDMILVSGFNVYPNEVEDVACAHPGVLEAACIGVSDEKSGEAVKLFVVRKDPGLDAQTLIAWCRENLTGYKVPRHVEFRDELPKSNVGKILRKELR